MILTSLLSREYNFTINKVEVRTTSCSDHYLIRCHVFWKVYELFQIILKLECMLLITEKYIRDSKKRTSDFLCCV